METLIQIAIATLIGIILGKLMIYFDKKEETTKSVKFKDIRNAISRINPISICFLPQMNYENFNSITEVSKDWDEMYVHGIGTIGIEDEDERVSLPRIEIMLCCDKK